MSYFMQFWPILGPYEPVKSPLYYQQITLNGSCSRKILHKIVLPENGFISIFLKWKWPKSAENDIFHAILTILGPYDPLKSPWYYQQSTFKGSYSPKSLHKLVLPENGFISIFFELKMLLGSPKVDVGGQNLQNFDLKRPIKFGKVLQTSQFLVKSCVLERSR